MGSTETDIGSPCTQCLRHGDPIHTRKGLTSSWSGPAALALLLSWAGASAGQGSEAARGPRPRSSSCPGRAPAPLTHPMPPPARGRADPGRAVPPSAVPRSPRRSPAPRRTRARSRSCRGRGRGTWTPPRRPPTPDRGGLDRAVSEVPGCAERRCLRAPAAVKEAAAVCDHRGDRRRLLTRRARNALGMATQYTRGEDSPPPSSSSS
jgi:hypothetical protein